MSLRLRLAATEGLWIARAKSTCADPLFMSKSTMSMRVIRPFLEAIRDKGVPGRMLRFLEAADPDARMSASTAFAMLEDAVCITQDVDLGLRAALRTEPGDYAALEYVAASSRSVEEALVALERYIFLAWDGARPSYLREAGRVYVEYFHPSESVCRAAVDYALALSYLSHSRWVGGDTSQWEVWFPYPLPESTKVHCEVFDPKMQMRFGASRSAFIIPESDLAKPLRTADPKLKELLIRYVEDRFGSRAPEASLIARVSSMILQELNGGNPAADPIAVKLGVSRRTLTRRLEEEGTSFKRLLSDVRCAMAVRYLIVDRLSISDVVKRLGYSEPAAFHKAFKRWLGVTPIEYIRQHRQLSQHRL